MRKKQKFISISSNEEIEVKLLFMQEISGLSKGTLIKLAIKEYYKEFVRSKNFVEVLKKKD